MAERKTVSRICTCTICGVKEISKQAILPEGWAIPWEYKYHTLCTECRAKWRERFGQEPVWYEEGPEEYDWL